MDSKGQPWRMVLRGSPLTELQILCGGKSNYWYSNLPRDLPEARCDLCRVEIDWNEFRWVCESSVHMDNVSTISGECNVHRPQKSDKTNTLAQPVTSVCMHCISKDGVVDCGICGETKHTRQHRYYTQDGAALEYGTPCTQCEHPVCKYCLIAWSNRCKQNGMTQTTCPFCRTRYDHYTMKSAGWQSSLRSAEDEGQVPSRSDEASKALESIWQNTQFSNVFNQYHIKM